MKICIDAMCLSFPRESGIFRYVAGLLPGLLADSRHEFAVCVEKRGKDVLEEITPGMKTPSLTPAGMRYALWWKSFGCGRMAAKIGADTLFIPVTRIPLGRSPRTVIVVHDMGFVTTPEYYRHVDRWGITRRAQVQAIRHADRIIADSNFVRQELIEGFGVPAQKVVTVHLGCDEVFFETLEPSPDDADARLQRVGIDRPFLLYVGVIQPRKNLARLIRAFKKARCEDSTIDFQLVLAGPKGWGYEEVMSEMNDPQLGGKAVILGRVDNLMLRLLYQRATAAILPSYSEGFGLPVVEAMASGTPVLCSKGGSLPEVGGEAAFYFPPDSTDEMASAILQVFRDPVLRQEMKSKGLRQARMFSWERCAKETLAALTMKD